MLTLATNLASNLLLLLWLAAALALWAATRGRRRQQRRGVAALIAVWVLASRPAADVFLYPLESRYDVPSIASLREQDVQQVVVLTGGGYDTDRELLAAALPDASAHRFLAGIELCARLGSGCRTIFTGSAGRSKRHLATAETMRELARKLSPGRRWIAEAASGSTAEHPANVQPLLAPGAFILVTSAYHMPRAMRSFRRAGLAPIAYPVAPMWHGPPYRWSAWMPSFQHLQSVNVVWREYLALLFYTLRSW